MLTPPSSCPHNVVDDVCWPCTCRDVAERIAVHVQAQLAIPIDTVETVHFVEHMLLDVFVNDRLLPGSVRKL